jgi:hypothetical protein
MMRSPGDRFGNACARSVWEQEKLDVAFGVSVTGAPRRCVPEYPTVVIVQL